MASLLPKDDIYKELEILKARVSTAKMNVRRYKSYLQPERTTFSALQQKLKKQLQGREKRSVFAFFLSALPTTLIYIGMYFALIPKNYYEANSSLYLAACGIIFSAWIGWFLLTTWAYKYLLVHTILPYTSKYPVIAGSTQFAAQSFFILVMMNPLYQAAYFAGRTITPSWGTFLSNLWMLLLGVGSGNLFTAIANSLAIGSFLFVAFVFFRDKRGRRKS
jgi:hypothetical protein